MANGFKIAARALRQLGAETITSDEIALNELIKNSFDAGSNRVNINISYPIDEAKLLKDFEDKNEIKTEVICDYFNESVSDIEKNNKLAEIKKLLGKSTPKGELIKFLQQYNKIEISDSGIGMSRELLENAFLVIGTPFKWIEKKNNDTDKPLLGEKGVGRLSMMRLGKKASIMSTTSSDVSWHEINFDWTLFDDPEKMLDEIEINITKCPTQKNAPEMGTKIIITELTNNWTKSKVKKFTNQYLRRLQTPFTDADRYPVVVKFNDEKIIIPAIHEWFKEAANFFCTIEFTPNVNLDEDIVLKRTLKWFEKSSDEVRFWTKSEIKKLLNCKNNDLIDIGYFSGNCLWFNRKSITTRDLNVNVPLLKEELNLWCGGFAIYRDGFRIGMTGSLEDDWMEMDKTALKSSGYSLNRYQTVGAIDISSKNNPKLIDSANRESLVSCDSYDFFKKIMMDIVAQDLRSHIKAFNNVEAKISIAEDTTESALEASRMNLKKTLDNLRALKNKAPKEIRDDFLFIEDSIKNHYEDVRKLSNAVEDAREKNVELLELAGVGMVVEKVIHELARLTSGAQEYLKELEKGELPSDIQKVINVLKQQMKATNKRIRTVDILSPSGRQTKDNFNLLGLIESIIESNASKLERHGVVTHVLLDGKKTNNKFIVYMVQGLVAQIIENLINNSVYWLSERLIEGDKISTITINIDSNECTMSFKDNGPGIEPRYKNEIIKPYFTTRHGGKGLGLYIARELAEYHKTKFYLDDEPDDIDGRLRKFILELPKGKKNND